MLDLLPGDMCHMVVSHLDQHDAGRFRESCKACSVLKLQIVSQRIRQMNTRVMFRHLRNMCIVGGCRRDCVCYVVWTQGHDPPTNHIPPYCSLHMSPNLLHAMDVFSYGSYRVIPEDVGSV